MNEADLRTTLALMAHEVDVPDDLGAVTMTLIRSAHRPSPRDRRLARRDARKLSPRGPRRWTYVAATGVAAVSLLTAGTLIAVRRPVPPHAHSAKIVAGAERGGGTQNTNDALSSSASSGSASGSNSISGPAVSSPVSVVGLNDLPQIVHTADIKVQVKDFERAWGHANDVAQNDGGYVTSSSTSESSDHTGSGTLTVRVPSGNLEQALHDLRALGTMTALTTSGNDVSAPIADLNARKKDAEAEEASLQNLLNNASSVSDVLDIKSRLNDTRNDIESIEGQLHGYQNQVDYATIHATVFDEAATPHKPLLGSGTLGRGIHTGGHLALAVIAGASVVLGGLLPVALLVLLGWFVVRKVRHRTR